MSQSRGGLDTPQCLKTKDAPTHPPCPKTRDAPNPSPHSQGCSILRAPLRPGILQRFVPPSAQPPFPRPPMLTSSPHSEMRSLATCLMATCGATRGAERGRAGPNPAARNSPRTYRGAVGEADPRIDGAEPPAAQQRAHLVQLLQRLLLLPCGRSAASALPQPEPHTAPPRTAARRLTCGQLGGVQLCAGPGTEVGQRVDFGKQHPRRRAPAAAPPEQTRPRRLGQPSPVECGRGTASRKEEKKKKVEGEGVGGGKGGAAGRARRDRSPRCRALVWRAGPAPAAGVARGGGGAGESRAAWPLLGAPMGRPARSAAPQPIGRVPRGGATAAGNDVAGRKRRQRSRGGRGAPPSRAKGARGWRERGERPCGGPGGGAGRCAVMACCAVRAPGGGGAKERGDPELRERNGGLRRERRLARSSRALRGQRRGEWPDTAVEVTPPVEQGAGGGSAQLRAPRQRFTQRRRLRPPRGAPPALRRAGTGAERRRFPSSSRESPKAAAALRLFTLHFVPRLPPRRPSLYFIPSFTIRAPELFPFLVKVEVPAGAL